jgi:hypothetical protein
LGDRQARVRVGNEGQIRYGAGARQEPAYDVRTKSAVEAYGRCAERVGQQNCRFHVGPVQQLAVLVERKSDEHRQVAVLPRGQKGSLGFVRITLRFNQNQVRSGLYAGPYLFCKEGHGFFKRQIAEGFNQFSRRSDIQSGEPPVCRSLRTFRPGAAGIGEGRRHDLGDGMARPGQFQCIGTEGIRFKDIGAGRNIRPVDRRDRLSVGHIPKVCVFPGLQAGGLQLRAHGPVEIQQFFS